jgi:sirohydrochlorin ferrochelatase
MTVDTKEIGVIVVDHGSRRKDSNRMLLDVVKLFEQSTRFRIVEAAHMDLAEPSIGTAFDRCVRRGAKLVVIHPYFLLPGRHWQEDIPALVAEAADRHRGVRYLITAPLGLHPLLTEIIKDRVEHCLDRSTRET